MENAFNLIVAMIPIYAMVFVGWLMRRIKWFTPESDSSFTRFAIDVSLPCFIFYNMVGNEKLASVGYATFTISLGIFGMLMCLIIAWFCSKILKLKVGDGQRTFVVTAGVQNYGFFIIALVSILYPQGDELMGLVLTHNVGCDIVFWTLGLLLISATTKFSPAILLKGPVLSVFIALFFIWTGFAKHIPDFAMTSLKLLGAAAIPLNLIIFGTLICDMFGFKKFSFKIVGTAVILRMVIMPCAFIALAVFVPMDILLKKLLVFQAVAPSGVISAVLAKNFGGHPQIAVQIIVATMVVAFITVPFWMWVGMSFLGQ